MKILFLKGPGIHHKNEYALSQYKNIRFYKINRSEDLDQLDLSQYDCVYSPSTPISAIKYPGIKFIFGPHLSVLPNKELLSIITAPNAVYIQPSEWAANAWSDSPHCVDMEIRSVPFAVDIDRFREVRPIHERTQVFIYYKNRSPNDINFVMSMLQHHGIVGKVFQYGKYTENEYLSYLQQSKCGIIVDAHESQGFAIEEALSCGVPLLVWSIKSMNQEYRSSYPDIKATTVPYWDDRCGEVFYESSEFESKLAVFLSNLETYRPRDYIVEHLSPDVCEKQFTSICYA
jgi:glycosyltransferase involved in cell wall biosynthesis